MAFSDMGKNYMKGTSNIIPSETRSGQLSMFSGGAYSRPAPAKASAAKVHSAVLKGIKEDYLRNSPPFKPTSKGKAVSGASRLAARNAELGMKARVNSANAAITQQNAMDVAKSSGQITDREIVKQNRLLNARRKAALPNAKIMSTNPSGGGAKASTLGGRSWMWNIGTKTK